MGLSTTLASFWIHRPESTRTPKKFVIGTEDLELSLIDFMFKCRFNAIGGPDQIVNIQHHCFNAYI